MRSVLPGARLFPATLLIALCFGAGGAAAATLDPLNRVQFADMTAALGLTVITEHYDQSPPYPASHTPVESVPVQTPNGVGYSTSKTPTEGAQVIVTNKWSYSSYPNTLGSTSDDGDPGSLNDGLAFHYDEIVNFIFSKPILGFAIDIVYDDPLDGAFMATTDLGDTSLSIAQDLYPGWIEFGQAIGFISLEPFTSVAIAMITGREIPLPGSSTYYSYNLDTMRIAHSPLPAAVPLFATGLAALGLLTWRRRRRATIA